jgi:hypothetical protein
MADSHDPDLSNAELRTRLRAADPAAVLPQAEPDQVDGLLRRVTEEDLRETGTRRRNPLTWLVAAAAVVVIAAGVAVWVNESNRGHTDGGLLADPAPTTAAPGPQATSELTVAAAGAGRCIMPTPALLAAKPIAFAGTVVGVADGVATLRPTTVFAGQVADEVTVRGAVAPDTGGAVEGDPAFEAGEDYLVAVDDGQVIGCGLSGPVTPGLQRLYTTAFPQ